MALTKARLLKHGLHFHVKRLPSCDAQIVLSEVPGGLSETLAETPLQTLRDLSEPLLVAQCSATPASVAATQKGISPKFCATWPSRGQKKGANSGRCLFIFNVLGKKEQTKKNLRSTLVRADVW